MEPISSFVKNSEKIRENNERIYNEIINHPKMKQFMAEHEGEITRSMIQNDLMILKHYINQPAECETAGEGECLSHPDGFIINLEIRQGRFNMLYTKCPVRAKHEEFIKRESLIPRFQFACDVREVTIDTTLLNGDRSNIVTNAIEKTGKIPRGAGYR